jgi:hypothetical protein
MTGQKPMLAISERTTPLDPGIMLQDIRVQREVVERRVRI